MLELVADDRMIYLCDNLKDVIDTFSQGFESNDYKFMDCVSLIYGVIVRGALSPMLRTFVCETMGFKL